MIVRMKSNLFEHARFGDVIIPAWGETVDLLDDDAQRLIDEGHAEDPEGKATANPAHPRYVGTDRPKRGRAATLEREQAAIAAKDAEVVPAPEVDAPEVETVEHPQETHQGEPVKRGPGRPRKDDADK